MPEVDSSPLPAQTSRVRTLGMLLVKIVVTAGLIAWLVRSGSLNFQALGLLWSNPRVATSAVLNFFVGLLVTSTFRWRLLLSATGIRLSLRRAAGLQTIAVFFNYCVPGNVSGDLIKNHAVVDRDPGKLIAVALMERVAGLIGLVWVAVPAVAIKGSRLMTHPGGTQLLGAMLLLFVGSIIGLVLGRILLLRVDALAARSDRDLGWLRKLTEFLKTHLKSGLFTLRQMAEHPKVVFQAIALSMVMHAFAIVNFWNIATFLGNPDANLAEMALVYPIGILSVIIPVSISGMGVGHVLFNELFKMVGLIRGADVFNVHIFSGLLQSLIGVVPYLSMRKAKARAGVGAQS